MDRFFDAARTRYLEAERIAIVMGDASLHIHVLNNLAYTAYEAGNQEEAAEVARRMLALAAEGGEPLNAMYLDTVARTQMGLGDASAAVSTMQEALAQFHGRPDARFDEGDGLGEMLLSLAEAQRMAGDLEGSRDSIAHCLAIAEERHLGSISARAYEQLAELHATDGAWQEAFETYREFHRRSEVLRSMSQESAAHSRRVMLETDEAQRAADTFREQALRDPLTGLYNRRFVDERLPLLLHRAAESGAAVSVGLVDLDHFKRVNDTLSHATGDRVLVAISQLFLETLASEGPYPDDIDPCVPGSVAKSS